MLCYSENVGPSEGAFDPSRCNAVRCYMGHFDNSLYLTFMMLNGSMKEKHQASIEMPICERKMKYWENQPHFEKSEADRQRSVSRGKWA